MTLVTEDPRPPRVLQGCAQAKAEGDELAAEPDSAEPAQAKVKWEILVLGRWS